ncbi:MAG: 4Fe-4S binding protein [Nitrospirae bacterium]|nr:4Fe-4S binding protein [Nitrospirota bacterium]
MEENFKEAPLYLIMWGQHAVALSFFGLYLISLITLLLFKASILKKGSLIKVIRYVFLLIAFVFIGLVIKAQPTSTNIAIMIGSLKDLQFPLDLYLMEPFIFITFIFMAITTILWGRGVFCGWVCPYGAMLELLNSIYDLIPNRPRFSLPEKIHSKLIYLKYIIFIGIIGISLYSFMLSEYLTEIEPFKTFVLKLNREWYFVGYFLILTILSVLIYRFFCLYICPMGASIAMPSLLKWIPLIKIKRYDLCGKCNICKKDCASNSIAQNGKIIESECLYCLECQKNYQDSNRCTELIKRKKSAQK